MPVVNNVKVACEPCIRGHRATSCNHGRERRLVPVRKPGRPLREFRMRPAPLTTARKEHGCRCGGAAAVGPDGEVREGRAAERRRATVTPEPGFQLPSPCSSQSHGHGSAAGSPSPAVPQPLVDQARALPPSPATTSRDRHPSDAQPGPLESRKPATALAPVHAADGVSPPPSNFNEYRNTHMYGPALEAPSSWTPPVLAQTPGRILPNAFTTQPIGVNLPLCTHCAGQTPGVVQPQVLVLNHLGLAPAWPPGASNVEPAAGNTSPQAVIVYVSVQPQETSVEWEPQDSVATHSVHDTTREATVPQYFQPSMSNGVQVPSGGSLDWLGQLHTGISQAIVGSPTNTMTGEGLHGCTTRLQVLPLSPTQMPYPCVDELNTSLLSPAPEPTGWNCNLSNLHLHFGDAVIPPLSGCRCGDQHSCGCDLGCMPEAAWTGS